MRAQRHPELYIGNEGFTTTSAMPFPQRKLHVSIYSMNWRRWRLGSSPCKHYHIAPSTLASVKTHRLRDEASQSYFPGRPCHQQSFISIIDMAVFIEESPIAQILRTYPYSTQDPLKWVRAQVRSVNSVEVLFPWYSASGRECLVNL